MSYVYFIERTSAPNAIKIGFSRNPENRLKSLQTGSDCKLQIIAKIPGTKKDESGIHKMFHAIRSSGEWFKDANEIRDFIAQSKNIGGFDIILSNPSCAFGAKKPKKFYITDEEAHDLDFAEREIEKIKTQIRHEQAERRTILARIRMRRLLAQEKSND